MIPAPGLCAGTLRHRRFLPRAHEFRYGIFMAWLDIDSIPELMAKLPWTSFNRFNWASFHDQDHFGDPGVSLRRRLDADARTHGVQLPDGPVYLLTHLRYLGYCFNPISFYFCYDSSGELGAVLAEVNSTFGESRNYWLSPANQLPSEHANRYVCPKTMHVSPFMDMNLDYEFVLAKPSGTLVAHMNTIERGGSRLRLLDATLALEHQPWTTGNLTVALLKHPWMTASVIFGIHWQALRLYLKKVPVFTHPARLKPAKYEEVAKGS